MNARHGESTTFKTPWWQFILSECYKNEIAVQFLQFQEVNMMRFEQQ